MKFVLKPLLAMLSLTLSLVAYADATIPEEGKQYVTLTMPLTDKSLAPISEVFSLTCGHCRQMERILPPLSQLLGDDIGKLHITFNPSANNAALFYYAAEMQLGHVPEHGFMEALFAAIQTPRGVTAKQKKQLMEEAFNTRNLVSPYQFNDQQNEQLISKLEQAQRLSMQSGINAVPTFIVKGRYQVQVAAHNSTEQLANTIKYLLAK